MQAQDIAVGHVYVTTATTGHPLRVRVTRVWATEGDGRQVVGFDILPGAETSGGMALAAFAEVYLPAARRYAVELECGHTMHNEFPPMGLRIVCRECDDVVSSMRIVTACTDLLLNRRTDRTTAA